MPLPNPDYLSNQNYNWDGTVAQGVQLTTSSSVTGTRRNIRWGGLDSYDRRTIHDLIMGYASRNALAESAAVSGFLSWFAYQVVNYGGSVVGGNNAGLVTGITYTATVEHNGVTVPISIAGSSTATFTDVVSLITTDLAAQAGATDATVAINAAGDIEFASFGKGSGQVIEVFDQNLFRSMTGFRSVDEKRAGVTTIEDVFDLNFRNDYQAYAELLIGHLRLLPNKAQRSAKTIDDVYFNHGTGTWLLVYTDVAPV